MKFVKAKFLLIDEGQVERAKLNIKTVLATLQLNDMFSFSAWENRRSSSLQMIIIVQSSTSKDEIQRRSRGKQDEEAKEKRIFRR